MKGIDKTTIYGLNKSLKVGSNCVCPSCRTSFIKTNYQQAFCKSKKGTVCKDKYWNTVIESKRNNTTRISPASSRWLQLNYGTKNRTYGTKEYNDEWGDVDQWGDCDFGIH